MSALSFPLNVYLAAFASAFATALLSLPLWRRWCLRTGLVDDPGHRKIHEQPIPPAGGLAVMTGLLVPVCVAALLLFIQDRTGSTLLPVSDTNGASLLSYGLNKRKIELVCILIGALGMLLVGLLDDKHELRPAWKFTGQL